MRLTFLGKDSQPNNSPTLYAAEDDAFVVQGWIVTDPQALAAISLADDETVVEVPAKLLRYLDFPVVRSGSEAAGGLHRQVRVRHPRREHLRRGVHHLHTATGQRQPDPVPIGEGTVGRR